MGNSGVNLNTSSNATQRGWGPMWPTPRHDMVAIRGGGLVMQGHPKIAELVELLLDETVRRGYPLDKTHDDWGYAGRYIAGTTTPSNHSAGIAFDLNSSRNPFTSGNLVTDMPKWMHELWNDYGFRWGGDYKSVKDAMHYEFMGTPADAHRLLERARRELKGEDDMAFTDFTDGIQLRRQDKKVGDDAVQDKKLGWWLADAAMKSGGTAPLPGPVTGIPAHTHSVPAGKTGGVA